jgi:UDP-N-acetylglucosamine/UDP-N-acetyl-alpha-D-glucosaminouronate 4-epimerase
MWYHHWQTLDFNQFGGRERRLRYLVTGAAGFIGSRLALRLVREGHAVVGLDDLSAGSRLNLVESPSIDLRIGDVRDSSLVDELMVGCDAAFHLAAVRSIVRSVDEPSLAEEVNTRGTFNVLHAAQAQSTPVVFASSSSVYGPQVHFPLQEDATPRPQSPYAATKLAGEIYCQAWWRSFSVPTVSLRFFNVFGPGMDPHNRYALVVPIFIQALLDGRRPVIHGDGEQSRDFTHVDDVVDVMLSAAHSTSAAWGGVYNIGGGRTPTTIKALLTMIAENLGVRADPTFEPARPRDMLRTEADVTRAREILGYDPKIGVEEGLRETVSWFKARHEGIGRKVRSNLE